ncbi:MAG: aldo/keto reductase [Planctomycetota bacterium]|jgi:aryl-alcohol dehydrogenase-like predicted oxidoreductase
MTTRREFLRRSAALAVAAAAARTGLAQEDGARKKSLEAPLPRRKLGETGLEVGILGLGCFYLGNVRDEKAAIGVMRRAFDLGVNYFDVAPSYNKGVAETRLGKALEGCRDRVLIGTKSTKRDGKGAAKELDESLQRLRTDHVDLFQFHALKTAKDDEGTFGEDGAYEAILAAKKAGKVRHIGFTGHYDPVLLASVAKERPVETVLLPLNCMDRHEKSFEEGTLPAARERKLGIIAMKLFASGRLLDDAARSPSPEDCVRYVLSLPVSTAIVGCSSIEELETDLLVAKALKTMKSKEREQLVARTAPFKAKKIEWYKR